MRFFRREATKGLPGGSLLQAGDCAIISGAGRKNCSGFKDCLLTGDEKLPRFACACLLPALPAKAGSAPGESGFTVTMRPTVQPSGSAFLHESSGTVARSSMYLDGQIISGDVSSASAISFSPRGTERVSAFASVEDASPALRKPQPAMFPFSQAAIISAGCQSGCIMLASRR